MRVSIFLLLLFAFPIQAQQQVKVQLHSGSTILGTTDLKEFPLQTEYGLLKIPVKDVSTINVGIHYEDGVKEKLIQAVKELASNDYKTRETAQLLLCNHHKFSIPLLVPGSDREANKRMLNAKEKILEQRPFADKYVPYDTIKTELIEARGIILLSTVDVFHPDFNTVKIKVSSIREIHVIGPNQEVVDLKVEGWYKCKINHEKLTITANGSIEFWPQTPGQYQSGPNGLSGINCGDMTSFRAGSLVGKVGEYGAPFLIGERHVLTKDTRDLYIRILEPGWRDLNGPIGSYRIILKGE